MPAVFELTPDLAEDLTGGRWIGVRNRVRLRGAAIDSRRVSDGNLFACFRGEHVDGHDFADLAAGAGAGLILASQEVDVGIPVLLVEDVAAALGALAAEFRSRHDEVTWIGVTGSNGKTTVKELLIAACAAAGPVHATRGNYNNQLGVPLTVLGLAEGTRTAVIELGASARGEIAQLAAIARPTVGVITSIGPAHLEGFGGLAGVAAGKTELFRAIPDGGRMLFCRHGLDQACADYGATAADILGTVRGAAEHGNLTVVGDPGCPIDGESDSQGILLRTPVGEVGLGLVGAHNLANACLAWHAAVAAGVDPKLALGGLAGVRPTTGRLQIKRLGAHRLLDDSYNANPASMNAGLAVLARQSGGRLAVLGGMGELGGDSEELHRMVGAEAARLGLPLVTVGAAAEPIGVGYRAAGGRDHEHATDVEAAVALVAERMRVGPTAILVKASRSAGLERVAKGLEHATGYDSGIHPVGGA